MKIYISHSTGFDYQKELYEPIKNSELYNSHEIIFPHDKSSEVSNSKEVIKGCDMVIAEVSYPSTGMGIELGWADGFRIPIVCICKKGSKVSESLKVVAEKLIGYENGEDLVKKLENVMK